MEKFIIILPTHSNYLKITENFLQILRKNWPNCPFKIAISITGANITLNNEECLYNGKDASLIDCIINATKKYKSEYYLNFLGDAFINKKIDDSKVLKILEDVSKNHIQYCSIQHVKKYTKEKIFNSNLRYINNLDRYSHNFTAFVASRDFIKTELSKYKTDLDFEKNYLFQTRNFYFDNRLMVRKNYFNLLPSIVKGKWDRFNLRKLQKDNPEVVFEERQIQTFKESLICHTRNKIVHLLPLSFRTKIKSPAEKIFNIDFGVDG